eukprot:1177789-Prorocentrum_minimum.AAC.1
MGVECTLAVIGTGGPNKRRSTVEDGGHEEALREVVQVLRQHQHNKRRSTVEHGGHEEALCEVVEVLRQHQHVVVLLAAARVQHAPLHARAEGANRVALEGGPIDD